MAITTNNLISRQTVGSAGAATVTFSSIPQTFTDLRVVISSRVDYTGAWQNINIELNGDSGSNYTSKLLYGNGSAAGSDTSTTTFLKFVYSNFNTSTASVFSNGEMYFPNYRTATYKSVSSDSVTENNAATVLTALTAGIWNDTAAITTIKFTPNQGSFGEFTTFSLYGISSNTSTQNTSVPLATGGDVITTDGSYWYHAFIASGTFTPLKALTADCLVVAGGGGGGASAAGGGGGAGGLRAVASQSLTASAYTVTIGAGGAAQTSGSTSTINSISSSGGGRGGDSNTTNQASGGAGGGAGMQQTTNGIGASGNSGSYSPVEGYAGGGAVANLGALPSGGGGGAGAVGTAAASIKGGDGGAGANSYNSITLTSWLTATVTGVSGYLAGGGGGAIYSGNASSSENGLGGSGGGGVGGAADVQAGTAGKGNTGSGGGGGRTTGAGGAGGSGLVIVRYAV